MKAILNENNCCRHMHQRDPKAGVIPGGKPGCVNLNRRTGQVLSSFEATSSVYGGAAGAAAGSL